MREERNVIRKITIKDSTPLIQLYPSNKMTGPKYIVNENREEHRREDTTLSYTRIDLEPFRQVSIVGSYGG